MAEPETCCILNESLFDSVIKLIKNYIVRYRDDRTSRVVDLKTPAEVRELIDLAIDNQGSSKEEILSLCDSVMKLSVHTCHPRFYNTLFTTYEDVALLGAFLSTTSNVNVYTYEMAPVYTLIENEVLTKVRSMIGWREGDGLFVPGGSIANLYGLLLARHKLFPDSKAKGMCGLPRLAIFCSEQSHYSVVKSAIVMGIGIENVVKVKCDIRGRMIGSELDSELTRAESQGIVPIAVVATAGTTVLGAIDPLDQIATVAEKHKVWLHVDGAIAGALLFSSKFRHRLAGIERVDSVSWNAHKSMGVPLQCSIFVTKHNRMLLECNSANAGYLFQRDKVDYDTEMDVGDKSIQCGRLSDCFKLWLVWKYQGMVGIEKRINHYMDINLYLRDAIRKRPRFYLLVEEPDTTNLCFWYLPPCMQDVELSLGNIPSDVVDRLAKFGPLIKSKMVRKGSMMLAYQPLPGGVPNCLRVVNINPCSTTEDMDFIISEIETLSCDIQV